LVIPTPDSSDLAGTGIEGLDTILGGGLPRNRLYLIQGNPGAGKTTAGLQFLLEGRARGESGLYVTLSETADELTSVARSHGWSLDGIRLYELAPGEEALQADYTLFHPSEVELGKTTQGVLDVVEEIKPTRVVIDSLPEMRLLARDPLRYRRQILALKQFFIGRHCTVLLLDDRTAEVSDLQLESLAHGVVDLEQLAPEYGAERRRLRVKKLRGVAYRGGFHDFKIATGGLVVYPRLVASEHERNFAAGAASSGIRDLDDLLGGGLDWGSSTLITGPAGPGKTTLGLNYLLAAVRRGEKAAFFSFEEGFATLSARAAGLGWDLEGAMKSGLLHLQLVNPAELSPGEFSHDVQQAVDAGGARVVVIDSLNGYLHAMPEERHLSLHLQQLLSFLNQRGVATLMVVTQHGFLGSVMQAPVDLSYLGPQEAQRAARAHDPPVQDDLRRDRARAAAAGFPRDPHRRARPPGQHRERGPRRCRPSLTRPPSTSSSSPRTDATRTSPSRCWGGRAMAPRRFPARRRWRRNACASRRAPPSWPASRWTTGSSTRSGRRWRDSRPGPTSPS
jgi:circadian clock protein KaiC